MRSVAKGTAAADRPQEGFMAIKNRVHVPSSERGAS